MGLAGSECWRIVLATMNRVFRKWGEPRLEMRRDLESNVPDWKGGAMPQYIPGTACWQPMVPKPPVHRRSSDRCLSRRWCLLACPYWAGKDCSAGRPPGERTSAASSTTARLQVASKCILREGRQREWSAQVIPGRSRFGSLLLVNHRPSNLCHSATNEPQMDVFPSPHGDSSKF